MSEGSPFHDIIFLVIVVGTAFILVSTLLYVSMRKLNYYRETTERCVLLHLYPLAPHPHYLNQMLPIAGEPEQLGNTVGSS